MNSEHLQDVEKAMRQSRELMDDYSWSGEMYAYEQAKRRYDYYKKLHDKGVLFIPRF